MAKIVAMLFCMLIFKKSSGEQSYLTQAVTEAGGRRDLFFLITVCHRTQFSLKQSFKMGKAKILEEIDFKFIVN